MSSNYTGTDVLHPTIVLPSDGDDENASSVSTPIEALADNDAYLLARTAQISAVNWNSITSWISALGSSTIAPARPASWDAKRGIWHMGYDVSGTFQPTVSPNGRDWFGFGASTFPSLPDSMSFDGSGNGLAFGGLTSAKLAAGSTTWNSLSGPTLSITAADSSATAYFAGVFVAVYDFAASGAINAAWTDLVSYTAHTGTLFTAGATGGAFPILAQSSTRLLVFSQSDGANYCYTDDGKAWTQGILPALLTGEQVRGACCALNVFYLVVGTSSACRVLSSIDGVTWSLIRSIAYSAIVVAATDYCLVLGLTNSWSLQLATSVDKGATWSYAGLGASGNLLNGSSGLSSHIRLASNGSQFLLTDSNRQVFSASKINGKPPVLT